MTRSKLNIIIDSKEVSHGHAWKFPRTCTVTIQSLQKYGCDYTVRGYTGIIGVERKSYTDYCSSITSGWKRFKNSLVRLRKHRFRIIIIEELLRFDKYSKVSTNQVIWKTMQLISKGIPVLFLRSSEDSSKACLDYFRHCIKQLEK